MMAGRLLRIAVWGGLALALLAVAYLLVSTTFMPYDDEGYVLISLRNYLAGLRLYDDVFSQYGPWPYVYHELITTGLDTTITHALGRALTVLHWTVTALLCGVLGWRLTRSQSAAFVTAIIVFGLSWQNTSEPSHPGSHISLLVALAAVIVTMLPETRRPVAAYAALGVITGLLLLTKINVGLLLAAGLGCFVLCHTPWPESWRRGALALAAVGLLAVPWVLLGRQLGLTWVLILALQFTLAALGLFWLAPPARASASLPGRAWVAAPLACLVAGALVCFRVWQQGTSAGSLIQAILINPLNMPAKFIVGINWYPEVWLITTAGVATVFQAGREIRAQGRLALPTLRAFVVLRGAAVAAFVFHAREWPTYFGIFHFGAYCLPLLPVFLMPLAATEKNGPWLARWGVAALALTQVLHAFPVAGSQLAWATFLCVPVLVAGVFDLRTVLPAMLPRAGRRLVQAGGLALIACGIYQLGLLAHTGWQRYAHSRPLDLPGAGDIRLDGPSRQALRLLSLNAGIHADMLFSRQGMYSHNLWSGVPTPTAQNTTQWFWLLNETQQQEIIARLGSTPRTALIISHSIDGFLLDHKIPVSGPLQDFVQRHYRPLFRYGDFTFKVPVDSRAVAFGRYEVLTADAPDHAGRPPVLFRANLALAGRPVSIRLESFMFPWGSVADLAGPGTQVFLEPINRTGDLTGPAIRLPVAQDLRGLYRLSAFCPAQPPAARLHQSTLVVRDANEVILGEANY